MIFLALLLLPTIIFSSKIFALLIPSCHSYSRLSVAFLEKAFIISQSKVDPQFSPYLLACLIFNITVVFRYFLFIYLFIFIVKLFC